ncbi:hypothetical protein DZF92_04870 [Clavibacter michiganensis subsp. insidiosus]|uniref:Uncharacterized protein n=2 Tax=Clavibacter michiganensis TaxID=28447 RepID=A0A0D5CFI1_9MICO|nr:hypothetical protein VO01_01670 [Clavibacter michiganensis subsp. insidiosus]AWF99614.1 hypothetical protein BEH61_13990 [Clavibacter michiganensis subsp. insidiosus]AWG00267.1 hypothetical protein BEH62_01470 [Clavibacter michiganensis subsp. insidiosus]OQJ61092.1 hypothetical protein B5P21_15110 [Clavibacter michiganensis subsp. insidiosus]RII87977.1 hypothetical protein DZF92_04870 [Clavibacter michiganensis subsp. insidiosus]
MVVAMDRKPIPLGVAVMVPLVLGVICFSLVPSAWSLVLYAVLLIGLAVVHRAVSRRPRREARPVVEAGSSRPVR